MRGELSSLFVTQCVCTHTHTHAHTHTQRGERHTQTHIHKQTMNGEEKCFKTLILDHVWPIQALVA
jgi:hypothetical protein